MDQLINDSTHLRRILPCEVWTLVTHRLKKSPDTLTNLSNASPYFRNLLSPKRQYFLFENTFKILATTIWKNQQGHLPLTTVFTCRGVCSHWNKVVDKLLQDKFSDTELPNNTAKLIAKKTAVEFGTREANSVSDFLEHFAATHYKPEEEARTRNPFIWNNLKVRLDREELSDPNYLEDLSSLLQKYGRHIHQFKLEICRSTLYIEDSLKLKDWLDHTPNLKSLTIFDETKSLEGGLSLIELKAELNLSPDFKLFPKLEFLETVHFQQLRSPIFNPFIVRSFSNIGSLNLSKCDENYKLFTLPFPNLSKFILEIDSEEMFNRLEGSSNVAWLRIYYLSIIFAERMKFIRFSKIVQMIQTKFGKSLESLYLQFPKAKSKEDVRQVWKDSIKCRLDIAGLSGVNLVFRDPTSLDFLLPAKNSLEELSLEIRYPTRKAVEENGREETIVKLSGFENNILDSNIPTIFTNLDEIGVLGEGVDEEKWYYL